MCTRLAFVCTHRLTLFSFSQLKALGFDCFPIDQLEGPPAVLAWLASEFSLNKIVGFLSLFSRTLPSR